jgi:hypothetical protein
LDRRKRKKVSSKEKNNSIHNRLQYSIFRCHLCGQYGAGRGHYGIGDSQIAMQFEIATHKVIIRLCDICLNNIVQSCASFKKWGEAESKVAGLMRYPDYQDTSRYNEHTNYVYLGAKPNDSEQLS